MEISSTKLILSVGVHKQGGEDRRQILSGEMPCRIKALQLLDLGNSVKYVSARIETDVQIVRDDLR